MRCRARQLRLSQLRHQQKLPKHSQAGGGTFLSKLRHWQNVAQTPITHKPILLGKQAQTVMASKPPRLFFKALSNRLIQS